MFIGMISDTHGLLRPEAVAALRGADRIIHAGDIGDPAILDRLSELAPVTAVRGNVDREAWAKNIPETNVLEVDGVSIYVLHTLENLDLKPGAAGFAAVIYGHSHVPKQEMKDGVLYFNPGSAGPRRFNLPVTMGRLNVQDGRITVEIIELRDQTPHPFDCAQGKL
jgi:uncharacterized protein